MTALDDAGTAAFEDLARRVDDARRALDALDPAARDAAVALQDAVEAFHRPVLVDIVRTLRADPRGKELLFALVDDPHVRAVLALHGIVRADPTVRAERALDAVRPYLRSHGGDVELARIDGGTAYVRLHGSCSGCSMSAVTLRETVAEALVGGVDEIAAIEVLDDQPTSAFIPVGSLGRKRETGWVRGPAIDAVPAGTMRRFDVTIGDRRDDAPDSFVLVNVDQRIAAFRNACVHQGRSLDGGLLDDGVLTCPWHGFRFDATSGECLTAPAAQLSPVPTRIDDGHVWVRAHGG